MILLLSLPALAIDTHTYDQNVKVDGKAVSVQPYLINGNNYFKLRDVAALLDGSGSQFEVTYSSDARQMYVQTDKAYTRVGGELKIAADGARSCEANSWALPVDGKKVSCADICPMQVNPADHHSSAECIRCGACVDICQAGSLHLGFKDKTDRASDRSALDKSQAL